MTTMTQHNNPRYGMLWVVLLVIILILLAWGCSQQVVPARSDTITRTVITEKVRDTTVYMTDSAGLYAYMYCDSMNQVRLRQIEQFRAGQFVKPKVVIRDNYVRLDCIIDSAKVSIAWTEKHSSETLKTVQVVKEYTNILTGWQWFQIWLCRILCIAGVLVALFFTVKSQWWAIILSLVSKLAGKIFKKKAKK